MPEGPQMVFLKEQAQPFIDQLVKEANGDTKAIPFDTLQDQPLIAIRTFGKEIFFCFPHLTLRIHLMLFGKYVINGALNRALRLGLEFENGWINFYASDCRVIEKPLDQLYEWSTDVMHAAFDQNKALQKLQSKAQQLICDALLDQDILAGVGNIIKNEVLFRQQVHPASLVGEIPKSVLKRLIADCVKFSFEYLDAIREETANAHFQVYRKKDCPRDLIPLRKDKLGKAGRSCYYCDKCQQLYMADSI